MRSSKEHVLKALLFINLWLQAFDGAATYMGVSIGYGEGNPVVAATFGHIGVGPRSAREGRRAGCDLALPGRSASRPGVGGTAITYLLASFAPWSVAFASL
jgi:hypothetical protein